MKSMKVIAFLAFLLNTILFATYYAVAKEALERIDPIMFTFFEITTLAPAGLCIVVLTWKTLRWPILKQGFLLGSSLSLALFTIAIALKYTTATGTAFFPALNGFLAALIAWIFLRQPVNKATWCAGLLSTIGVTLLILNSPMGGIRGVLIAFLGGLFFTGYVFLSDNHPHDAQQQHNQVNMATASFLASRLSEAHSLHSPERKLAAAAALANGCSRSAAARWRDESGVDRHYHTTSAFRQPSPNTEMTLFGIELLTMALWACLIALLFGDWEAIHMNLPKDGLVILYVAAACTFLPTLLTVHLQKYISPVTISFIYILEPVFSAIIAMLYLHEMLPLYGYIGGILVVAGAVIHTSGAFWQKHSIPMHHLASIVPVGAGVDDVAAWGPSGSPIAHNNASFSKRTPLSRRGGGGAGLGRRPGGSPVARDTTSVSAYTNETKLLGLRLTSHAPAPTYTITEPLTHTNRNIATYTNAAREEGVMNTGAINRVPTTFGKSWVGEGVTSAINDRIVYSMGAVEWVDDDICERPTRPVLPAHTVRKTRDLSVWLEENIVNQPTDVQPIISKSRVRTTEDLRGLTLPVRTGSKGPVWLEEDTVGTRFSASVAQFITRDSHPNGIRDAHSENMEEREFV